MEQFPEEKKADLLPEDRIGEAVSRDIKMTSQTKKLVEAMSEAAKNETIVRFCEKYPSHPLAREIYEKLKGESLANKADRQTRMAGPEGDIEDAYDRYGSVVTRREGSLSQREKDSVFLAEYANYFGKIEAALTPEDFAELMGEGAVFTPTQTPKVETPPAE